MNLHGLENASNIRSLARFNFVAGLPRSGRSLLCALLRQNPRFVATTNSPAKAVFAQIRDLTQTGAIAREILAPAQKSALLRGTIDAVFHDRPLDSTVFDANPDWLGHTDALVRLYPLCRFIICVRNPAAIVNSLQLAGPLPADGGNLANRVARLMAADGMVGAEIGHLRDALSGAHAERMFVLDYDRLADDPEEVMDVLYEFLREPEFPHDFHEIGDEAAGFSGPVQRSDRPMALSTRMILQLSGRAFWRNLRRTSATMMLGRSR